MNKCKGRSVSDVTNKYKIPFEKLSPSLPSKFYHIPIICNNDPLTSGDLCGKCLEKEKVLKSCSITNNTLKNSSGRIISHPSVLHGRIDEPIPKWSHLENGEWFKNMLLKGYKAMPENTILKEVSKLTGKNSEKIEKLILIFPTLTKTAALNMIIKANKSKKNNVENVIESLQSKLYIDPKQTQEVYEIVKVIIKPIIIDGNKYYYDSIKNKLYDTELQYIGRLNKDKNISKDYPDSDTEPNFT
jgi:hypothetical protein